MTATTELSPWPPGALRVTHHPAPHTVLTIDGVLSPQECASLVDETERRGFTDAPITTARGFVMNPDVRNNSRVMVDDPTRAAALWSRVGLVLPERIGVWRLCGLNERLRFYRYTPGQLFDWHLDGSFVRNEHERSLLTILFYLNADFEGGATRFDFGFAPAHRAGLSHGDEEVAPPRELTVAPRQGSALVFVHAMRHQGARVERGCKYVMRSDVMAVRTSSHSA